MSSYHSVRRDVAEFLTSNYDIALDEIAPETALEDLGIDSLGMFSVVTLLENKHGFKFDSATMIKLRTVADLLEVVRAQSSDAE